MNTRPHPRRSPLDGAVAPRYRVGDLEVDLGRVRVTRDGREIPLPRLSFDLLAALARVAPNVATYEELMHEVWPGVVVGPETVSQRVKLLREALGDDARDSRYVVAVRGRGYRLVPEVVPTDASTGGVPEAVGAPATRASADAAASNESQRVEPTPANGTASEPRVAPASHGSSETPGPTSEDAQVAPRGAMGTPGRTRPSRVVTVAAVTMLLAAAVAVTWYTLRSPSVRAPATGPPSGAASPAAATPTPPAALAASVAVLPFESIGPDPVESYATLGVAEMVLDRLSRSRGLDVVARRSSFALDTRGLDARAIGQRLGARFLVQGGVQRAGDRMRVTVQLVDATTGRQLDSMRFDAAASDPFALQDEIAAAVAARLDVQLAAGAPGTRDPDAQLAYLQGLELLGRWRGADADAALAKFARARELDPRFAAAYVGEVRARRLSALLRGENPPPRTPELVALAERALALDPQLGAAHVLRGAMSDDPVAAEAALRRGIDLSPSDADAHLALGDLLSRQPGRVDEALAALDRAVALDPLHARARYLRALVRHVNGGGVAEFEEELRKVLEVDPEQPSALTRLGLLVAAQRGAVGEGLALLERSLASDPTAWFTISTAAEMYLSLGLVDEAAALVGDHPRGDALRLAVAFARGDTSAAARLALPTAAAMRAGAKPVAAIATVSELAAVLSLRDEALRSGRLEDGRRALREHHCRPAAAAPAEGKDALPQATDKPPWDPCVTPWTLTGALALAQLDIAAGRRPAGEALARDVLEFADSEDARSLPHPYVASNRARALMVLGRDDEAVVALDGARRARGGLLGWWAISRDATFDPVRSRPDFQAAVRAIDAELARERASYARLKREPASLSAGPPSPATSGSAARTAR